MGWHNLKFASLVLASSCLVANAACAQAVADFYRDRAITIIVATSAGGDYDNRARLVSRHMHKHIPGGPKFVVQNMAGGGGLRGANWLYGAAARDGSVLAALEQQTPLSQVFGRTGVEFDLSKCAVIGNTSSSPIVLVSWHSSPVKTMQQALEMELVIGATGAGSASVQVPQMLNALIGTKFKIIAGYPGGNEIYHAMESGEVAGRATQNWAGWKAQKPDWLAGKKLNLLAQAGHKRLAGLPDVPLLFDFAKNPDDRQVLELFLAPDEIARPLVAGPGVPADRIAALRLAFMRTMEDPEFKSEAARARIEIDAMSGEDAQRIVERIIGAPQAVVTRAKQFAETK